jgi:hypothetical protein
MATCRVALWAMQITHHLSSLPGHDVPIARSYTPATDIENEPGAQRTAWSGRGVARSVCIRKSLAPHRSGRAFDVMSPLTKRWVADISIVTIAVCLFLPVYIYNAKYGREHAATGKAIDEAQRSAGTNDEQYSQILQGIRRGHESPEFYYRRRQAWASYTLWLSVVPLVAGLMYRRWLACAVVLILWVFSFSLQGVRF